MSLPVTRVDDPDPRILSSDSYAHSLLENILELIQEMTEDAQPLEDGNGEPDAD